MEVYPRNIVETVPGISRKKSMHEISILSFSKGIYKTNKSVLKYLDTPTKMQLRLDAKLIKEKSDTKTHTCGKFMPDTLSKMKLDFNLRSVYFYCF